MNSLKLCETRKKHYGKYLYKLVLVNPLNNLFRTDLQKEKLSHARESLDVLTEKYRNNIPLTKTTFRTEVKIAEEHYFDAKDIYSILKKSSKYKIRVAPHNSLTIYSNDRAMLIKIANHMRVSALEFWEPSAEILALLTQTSNIVVVDRPTEFPLKITFKGGRVNSDFANWLRANRDKSRIGDKALDSLEKYGYLNNFYMFVRDEKVLSLVTLLVGAHIRCVEKLVYKEDIDKYKYGSE